MKTKIKTNQTRENPIPESKIKSVKELEDLIKNKKTILIASIKDIPCSQFQEIVKKLRSKAIIKVPKKNLIFRVLDKETNEEITKLRQKIKKNFTLLFSDLESFELAGELAKNKSFTKAKAGQEAPIDIEIPEGPTELVPGPAISELGALGIQIQIEKGKITIKTSKIIAKKGEKISQNAADLMAKLDIKPFKIGFIPLCAFDSEKKVFYANIKVDKEVTIENLKIAYGKALGFSLEIEYISKDTITFFISKANAQANKINRIVTGEPEPVVAPLGVPQSSELGGKEKKEEVQETKKEEPKAASSEGLGALFG